MTDNIVSLTTRPKIVHAETVQVLKDYLAMAEAGEIVGVAIAAVAPDGAAHTATAETDHFVTLLGAISILHYRAFLTAQTFPVERPTE